MKYTFNPVLYQGSNQYIVRMTEDENEVEDKESDKVSNDSMNEEIEGESKRDSEGEENETTLNQVNWQL